MFASSDIEARGDEAAALWRCARLLRGSVLSRLPYVRCVTAGSVADSLALSASVVRDVDLDVFLVFPQWMLAERLSAFGIVDELIEALAQRYGWRYIQTASHYRLYIADASNRYLDVTLLFRSTSNTAMLVDRWSGDTRETGVLRWMARDTTDRKILNDTRNLLLNFKLWAKTSLPYAIRPSSTLLTAMFTRTWVRSDTPWTSFRDTLTHMANRLSYGSDSFLVTSGGFSMALPILSGTTEVQKFVSCLENFAHELRRMTANDYRAALSERCALDMPVRVFLSSRQRELRALRLALSASSGPDVKFVLAEEFFDWKNTVSDGMAVCEARVRATDVFVGVYYREYGERARNRPMSPIEEEYRIAASQMSGDRILLFKAADVGEAECQMVKFLQRVEGQHRVQEISINDVDRARGQIMSVVRKRCSALGRHSEEGSRFNRLTPRLRALCQVGSQ